MLEIQILMLTNMQGGFPLASGKEALRRVCLPALAAF